MPRHPSRTSRRPSQGAALMFALLALVALSLAALGLIRSAETSTLIIGNLGFRQEATAVAEQATEEATAFISSASSLDNNGSSGTGYYASSHDAESIDVTGQQLASPPTRTRVDWDDDNCGGSATICLTPATLAADKGVAGFTQQYVILRLCATVGATDASGNTCSRPPTSSGGETDKKSDLGYGQEAGLSNTSGAYYRIVVRVKELNRRETTSFTETIVHQ